MSHPVELVKPSTAAIDTAASSHEHVNFLEDTDTEDHRALLRNASGQVAYPKAVPPVVESPLATAKDGRSLVPSTKPDKNSFAPPKAESRKPQRRKRPSYPRFLTDAQPSRSRATTSLARAATNTSVLNNLIWDSDGDRFDDPADLSSEDEQVDQAEDVKAKGKPRNVDKRARKKPVDDNFGRFRIANDNFQTQGKVSRKDGRLNININDTSSTGYLAKTLEAAIQKVVPRKHDEPPQTPSRFSSDATIVSEKPPNLNIVVMVIGSRGDIQPFLRIGKVLQEHGHRVRIATHPAFREFVEKDSGLEFFSVGGDPSELMAFMVKNPGLIPKLETLKAGEISRRRAAMAEMFDGFWRACINATDNETDERNLKMMDDKDPFIADAIIANPPSFAHVHCAEALGVPLEMCFTFAYTPTTEFPHPLANIKKSNIDPGYTNFMSYPLVEMMVWQGLGDLVNEFRIKTLHLEPVHTLWAPGLLYRLHVPFTYLWSPALIPKPHDWGEEVDVAGFVYLDLASSFEPPQDLVDFLDAGEPPIYIGFGSIVVDDADKFTEMIFEAVHRAGVRALVSKGWGGLGHENTPENIHMLENTPHDWLFPKVKACVIHGGAGTTAIALKCGKPTMVVPFFGDQKFWGHRIQEVGAGPPPIPYKKLSAENLAEGIEYCLTEEALAAARKIAHCIEGEGDGAQNAVKDFHRHLTLTGQNSMRCSILHDRVAVWTVKNTNLKLSAQAANLAVRKGLVQWRQLRLLRHRAWNDFQGPGEPVTGIAGSLIGTARDILGGIGGLPFRMAKTTTQRRKKATTTPDDSEAQTTNTQSASAAAIAPHEYLDDVQEGVGKSGLALARAPLDLSLALAQGFHNAPRLYGDETVREPRRVTGIRSGLQSARDEFVYGIYDGVTGIVRQPVRGAKEDGVRGAARGLAMGLVGFVLKDLAAICGPIADEEVEKGLAVMRELATVLMEQQENKGFVMGCIPKRSSEAPTSKSLTKWAKGPGFESVEIARNTIESVRRGRAD